MGAQHRAGRGVAGRCGGDRRRLLGWLAALPVLQLGLAGCATPLPPASPLQSLLADEQHGLPPADLPSPEAVLAIDEAMRGYLERRLRGLLAQNSPQRALVQALYARGELQLDYDSGPTRTAREAFAARRGNCLSLVLMTAAFAQELGIHVTFNQALIEDEWRREGGLVLRAGHVNLTLRANGARWASTVTQGLMIDFLPTNDLAGLRTEPIEQATVLAMFYNNRAVELLGQGRIDAAYWHVRQALWLDPGHDGARNTLGVVHLRSGRPDLAERAYAQVLQRRPDDLAALANLASLHEAQGRLALAQPLRERRRQLERALADEAWKRSLKAWRRGDAETAERALVQAEAISADETERVRYGGKLAWLRAQRGGGAAAL